MVKLVKLFPQYMLLPAVGGIALLAAAGYMVKRGISFWLALAVLVIGFAILYILALSYGVSALQNRLAWLYQNLEPERFLEKFEKLLPRAKKTPALEVTVRAYLADGHAAIGEFDQALALLDGAPVVTEESERLSAALLMLNNKGLIHFRIENAEKGKECLDKMRELLERQDEAAQKRYAENVRILQCHYDALTGVCQDDAYLRELVRNGTTALFRVNTSLLLARVYLSQGETNMARAYLEQTIEKGRDWLWPTKKAQQMLAALPAEE